MQQKGARYVRVRALWLAAALAAAFWARDLIYTRSRVLFFGMLVALAALPVMKRLEKRFSPGASATLSITSLSALLIASLLLLAPALITQGRQLIAMLRPCIMQPRNGWSGRRAGWRKNGIALDGELRGSLLSRGEEALSAAAPAAMAWVGGVAGSLGKWMLAPVFGFYFLRDRRQIGQWLLSLTPVEKRDMIVHILREMRRETAGYLRGQLMVSAVVGGLTALGLMFCGVPAWLLLGVIMGVLELIPLCRSLFGRGPGGAVFLPGGLARTLWALGVVIVVQQLEGGMLSPQLMSDATRLHPVAVVLCVMLGGTAGGIGGILLSVPLLLCARAALRVIGLRQAGDKARP